MNIIHFFIVNMHSLNSLILFNHINCVLHWIQFSLIPLHHSIVYDDKFQSYYKPTHNTNPITFPQKYENPLILHNVGII